jgi:hypothetical protein
MKRDASWREARWQQRCRIETAPAHHPWQAPVSLRWIIVAEERPGTLDAS